MWLNIFLIIYQLILYYKILDIFNIYIIVLPNILYMYLIQLKLLEIWYIFHFFLLYNNK